MRQAKTSTTKSRRAGRKKATTSPLVEEALIANPPSAEEEEVRGPERGAIQALTLFLDEIEYAVPILRVREISGYGSVTPVPTTPGWIRGVMNLRGTVVPVVDLRAKLGLGATVVTRRTCLVIVELELQEEEIVMAVVVDGVNRVIDLAPDDIQEPPAFGTRVEVAFLDGLIHFEDRLVLLLNLSRVLSEIEFQAMRNVDLQNPTMQSVQE